MSLIDEIKQSFREWRNTREWKRLDEAERDRRIYQILAGNRWAYAPWIAHYLGISLAWIYVDLRRLERQGLIESDWEKLDPELIARGRHRRRMYRRVVR